MLHKKILILLFALCALPAMGKSRFYTINDGLSSSFINHIFQDSEGYIWVATNDGLNRFDGQHFVTFHHIANNTASLPNNETRFVFEDSNSQLWVGTSTGLARFDRVSSSFTKACEPIERQKVSAIIEDSHHRLWVTTHIMGTFCLDLSGEVINRIERSDEGHSMLYANALCEDDRGNIWIGTLDNGVYCHNPSTGKTTAYKADAGFRGSAVYSIVKSPTGEIYVAAMDGSLNRYDPATDTFTALKLTGGSISRIHNLLFTRDGSLWIASDGYGLCRFDTQTGKIAPYTSPRGREITPDSKIHTLLEDRQGNLWVGVFQRGIYIQSSTEKDFSYYDINLQSDTKATQRTILCILEDSADHIWFGTDNSGLYRMSKGARSYEKISLTGMRPLHSEAITALHEDRHRNIWIGTYIDGALRYNPATRRVDKQVAHDAHRTHITAISEDAKGRIWLGTNAGGIIIAEDDRRRTLLNDTLNRLDYINSLYAQGESMWIGSYKGLVRIDISTLTMELFTTTNSGLVSNAVMTISGDGNQGLWIGTGLGAHHMDAQGQITPLAGNDRLPSPSVTGIEIGVDGSVWIGTSRGLACYQPQSHTLLSYANFPGMLEGELARNCHFRNKQGRIYFGGTNGAVSFAPPLTPSDNQAANLVFTTLSYYDRSASGQDVTDITRENISHTPRITITPSVRSFTVGFQAVTYKSASQTRYYTRLADFNTSWEVVPDNLSSVTYANLNPGVYQLEVRVEIDSNPPLMRRIEIEVLPALWQTTGAKLFYILCGVVLLWLGWRMIKKRADKLRRQLTLEHDRSLMQFKLDFFTDISHEIRTPLTLVSSPLSKLMRQTTDPGLLKSYTLMNKNIDRILSLVNEVIDIRKMDNNSYQIHAAQTDLVPLVTHVISHFEDMAANSNVRIELECNTAPEGVWIDGKSIEKVLFNLLSNAIKHAPEQSQITVRIASTSSSVQIVVSDQGEGIAEELIDRIFDNFFQAGADYIFSSGLGLFLSRRLIEMHKGMIHVQNNPDRGCSFIIDLPLGSAHLSPDQLAPTIADTPAPAPQATAAPEKRHRLQSERKVLIVEDDPQIRKYLQEELSPYFKVLEASNGKIGLQRTGEQMPHLVISDIMMPQMNGIAMCAAIKNTPELAHIPVILLTAKSSAEEQVQGLVSSKADLYIPKPFNLDYLLACVNNLLENRTLAHSSPIQSKQLEQTVEQVKSADERFFERFHRYVEEHLESGELSIDLLSRELGISRVHLHRKIKAAYGASPSDYIRELRLKKACVLLLAKNLSVSEVAFKVGFNSPVNFSMAFKKLYGVAPSEYVEICARKRKRT